MNKLLWGPHFSRFSIPPFPCPRCSSGRLKLAKDDFHTARPTYVTFDDFQQDPTSVPERFVMFLRCTNQGCGEAVSVAGEVVTREVYDQDTSSDYIEFLEPKIIWPALPIINMNKRVPQVVKDEVRIAFQVFWTDYRVCASRLRTSLERLMDHFGVAKTRIRTDPKKAAPGKRVPLELAARIDKLPKKIGTKDFSEILHALRTIGNLGTHGSKVSFAAIMDAFKLYEMALEKLFEDESETAKAIIKRLKAHK